MEELAEVEELAEMKELERKQALRLRTLEMLWFLRWKSMR